MPERDGATTQFDDLDPGESVVLVVEPDRRAQLAATAAAGVKTLPLGLFAALVGVPFLTVFPTQGIALGTVSGVAGGILGAILVGLALLLGPPAAAVAAGLAGTYGRRTEYVVTTDRVVVARRWPFRSSVETITFGTAEAVGREGRLSGRVAAAETVTLTGNGRTLRVEHVRDADGLAETIRDLVDGD